MSSLRSRLLMFLLKHQHLFKLKWRPETIDWLDPGQIIRFRQRCEEGAKRFGSVPAELMMKPQTIGGMQAEWLLPPSRKKEKVLLFFHGGGYVSGSCSDHRIHAAKFVKGSDTAALLFDYRLAPEHPYPAALEDSLQAYRWLLDRGTSPQQIVFAGDSAGGGLCLATLLALKERGLPLPAAAVALSPWTDLACTGQSYEKSAKRCLSPEGTWTAFSHHYVGGQDPRLPFISPLYGDLHDLPPLLITVGSNEILYDDAVALARKADDAGVDITLIVGQGLFHCYPVCAPFFPEATMAMTSICAFIRDHLKTEKS